ncbi:MAG: response regulator [Candidatus Omnitrophica bacterium]|nr:response regulator [Candidatus Omnitrophota bacterium]
MANILFVDDEENLLKVYKSYLERKGHNVVYALKGEDGLEILKNHKIDLLILDLHLKEGMQGIDVLKEAHNTYPNLTIMILSGFGGDEDVIAKCTQLGAKKVLKKPLTLAELKENIEKLLSLT